MVNVLITLRIILAATLVAFVESSLAELPKSAQIDRYKNIVVDAMKRKDCATIVQNINRLEKLTESLPQSMIYAKAECLLQVGDAKGAMVALEEYISAVGQDGEYYERALKTYTRAENLHDMQRSKTNLSTGSDGNEGKEIRRVDDVLAEIDTEMVEVSAGCFQMGSPPTDLEQNIDETQHKVCLTKAFLIGKYELSQAQWESVMRRNPSAMVNCGPNCPVEQVSWRDVQRFIEKLNDATGLDYRLPTEAEWEYACRGGGKIQKYCGGNYLAELGWYDSNSGRRTHVRGQKQANALGIYDMSGNVSEHVSDRYAEDYYKNSVVDNPQGPEQGFARVSRGGSWRNEAILSRSASRRRVKPGRRGNFLGFRLARTR